MAQPFFSTGYLWGGKVLCWCKLGFFGQVLGWGKRGVKVLWWWLVFFGVAFFCPTAQAALLFHQQMTQISSFFSHDWGAKSHSGACGGYVVVTMTPFIRAHCCWVKVGMEIPQPSPNPSRKELMLRHEATFFLLWSLLLLRRIKLMFVPPGAPCPAGPVVENKKKMSFFRYVNNKKRTKENMDHVGHPRCLPRCLHP